jgi:cellulase/cellobiase CelA1
VRELHENGDEEEKRVGFLTGMPQKRTAQEKHPVISVVGDGAVEKQCERGQRCNKKTGQPSSQ